MQGPYPHHRKHQCHACARAILLPPLSPLVLRHTLLCMGSLCCPGCDGISYHALDVITPSADEVQPGRREVVLHEIGVGER